MSNSTKIIFNLPRTLKDAFFAKYKAEARTPSLVMRQLVEDWTTNGE